jgi:hypothetical protein
MKIDRHYITENAVIHAGMSREITMYLSAVDFS